jgi:hypothetical protein
MIADGSLTMRDGGEQTRTYEQNHHGDPMTTPTTSTALTVSTPAWTAGIYGQLDAARPVAELLAKSELVPKGFQGKPMDILIAGAMGARLGLDLFSSLSGIAVVNGRATLWGDALLAVCQQHPQFEDYHQEITGDGDQMAAAVTVKRKGRSPHTETFGVADAKRAGLWGKQGPWSQHPKRMMALRARAFALRTVFADALAGFHAKEELDDEPVDITASATVRAEPKPAKRRTVEAAEKEITPPIVNASETEAAVITAKEESLAAMREDEHAAKAEPKAADDTKPEAQPAKDLSVAVCVSEFSKLWKHSDAGKARAKAIQQAWKLEKIADLAGAADGDREAFLAEVEEAMAMVEG